MGHINVNVELGTDVDAMRRLIEYAVREAEKIGNDMCVYMLGMALDSLDDPATKDLKVSGQSSLRVN